MRTSTERARNERTELTSSDWLDVRWSAQRSLFNDGRLLVWFSCGAASACALKLLADQNPVALYCDTSRNEHPDNARFLRDVEAWTGCTVEKLKHKDYSTVEEVFDARQYVSGPAGAPCTVELKKVPRFQMQRPDDVHVFGMTIDEQKRIKQFEDSNFDLNLAWPLVQMGMSKADCLAMIREAGIEVPMMYRLGYENNNCLGCVKASSPHYWNKVRRDFPEVFRMRAEQSRKIGCKLTRYKGERIFLDELPEGTTERVEEDLSCGPQCNGGKDEWTK